MKPDLFGNVFSSGELSIWENRIGHDFVDKFHVYVTDTVSDAS